MAKEKGKKKKVSAKKVESLGLLERKEVEVAVVVLYTWSNPTILIV